jgi:transcriptional regulator with XRE-family HTH domain
MKSPSESIDEDVGRAIRELRRELGVQRKELAELAKVSYSYLSEIESGEKRPSSAVLQRISRGLEAVRTRTVRHWPGRPIARPGSHSEPSIIDGDGWEPAAPACDKQPARSGRSRFFHAERSPWEGDPGTQAADRHFETGQPSAAFPDRSAAIDELREHAERLSLEDVERLLDLARRLRR